MRLTVACSTFLLATIAMLSPAPAQVLKPDPAKPIEAVATGYRFTEGPTYVADPEGGYVLFTDTDNFRFQDDKIIRCYVEGDRDGQHGVALEQTGGSNGTFADGKGNLLTADQIAKQISRRPLDNLATVEVVAKGYDDKDFNGPNDLTADANGGVYFTDPDFRGRTQPEAFYYVAADGKKTQFTGIVKPNGIVLSPDGKTLYVASWARGEIWKYDVTGPGELDVDGAKLFARPRNPDGLAVDKHGNLYVASGAGVVAYTPDGAETFTLRTPGGRGGATNLDIGGSEGQTLYIASGGSLFRQELVKE